ncbi:MAG: DegT/DnrJ/EryC1/StrS family aminotransferase [Candidatus Acidiferrales bacterium]
MTISLSSPDIGELELLYVNSALRSRSLSLGPWLQRFEDRIAEYTGAHYAVAVNSGTSALHLCVRAMGIGPGDEVITTGFSFVASVNCLLYEGAHPVFVDIDLDTFNIDPDKIREFLAEDCTRSRDGRVIHRATSRTVKAILPVHVFGLPCDMDAIAAIAKEYGLGILEDACEAFGTRLSARYAGTFGDAGVFAFYPNKQITTAEGGVVVTDDARIAEECRSMRNQGRDADGQWLRHVRLGFNYRLSELHCALGAAQLDRADELLAMRRGVAAQYNIQLRAESHIHLPVSIPAVTKSWFAYVIQLRNGPGSAFRDRIRERLRQQGVPSQVYFPTIYSEPYFEPYLETLPRKLPHTERAAETCMALPFSSVLTEGEVRTVCTELSNALDGEVHGEQAVAAAPGA